MINALFSGTDAQWSEYELTLQAAFSEAGLDVQLNQEIEPSDVDYIICSPAGPIQDFAGFPRLKAVLNLWAGVENITNNPTLTAPLCRMVDSGLSEGMAEWVTGHILRYHLGIDAHLNRQDGVWRDDTVPPLARERRVGILGLGELGQAVSSALTALNFQVSGWSRTLKHVDGINCFVGDEGLEAVLSQSEYLILLLPHTSATENLLNDQSLACLPQGAKILNPGRGALIEDAALLSALETGQVSHATLDVFRLEPLPPEHPFWTHPRVTVTPHIASETRPLTASRAIAKNIQRGEARLPFLHVVDRQAGY